MLETGDQFVTEASDYDPIFVIELSEQSSDLSPGCELKDESFDVLFKHWSKQSLLGIALMKIRDNKKF